MQLALGAPWQWNCFERLVCRLAILRRNRRHGLRLPDGGLVFHGSRFLFHSGGFLLHHGGGFLLHGSGALLHVLAAVLFDKLLALNRENDLSGSGQPDRHTAAGRHVCIR